MRNVILFLGFLFIILVSGIAVLYFIYERPTQETLNSQMREIDVNIISAYNNELVKTGYVIFLNGNEYKNGTTIDNGYLLERILVNKTLTIHNKNLPGQIYYTYVFEKFLDVDAPIQVNLILNQPGSLSIAKDSSLGQKDKVILNVSSEGYFNKALMCLKWSSHIITTKSVFEEIEKPFRYKLYDRCYDLGKSIENTTIQIPLDYKIYDKVNSDDFIRVALIDRDCVTSSCVEEINSTSDSGRLDIIYEIKKEDINNF